MSGWLGRLSFGLDLISGNDLRAMSSSPVLGSRLVMEPT